MTAWSHSLKGIKVNGGIKIIFIKGIHKGLDRRLTDTDLVIGFGVRPDGVRICAEQASNSELNIIHYCGR